MSRRAAIGAVRVLGTVPMAERPAHFASDTLRRMSAPTRKQCIEQGLASCAFSIDDDPGADGSAPIYELPLFSEVERHDEHIERAARDTGVDARLIRAVMYVETTHGYYDAPLELVGINKSIRPMNVNCDFWGATFGDRESLGNPANNVRAGALMLKRIGENLPPGAPVRMVATLYNNLDAKVVSDYGARVEKVYETRPWESETD